MTSKQFWDQINSTQGLREQTITDRLIFFDLGGNQTYEISNCTFEGVVEFKEFQPTVKFNECIFKKDIFITSQKSVPNIRLEDCSLELIQCSDRASLATLFINNHGKSKQVFLSVMNFQCVDLKLDSCKNIKVIQVKPTNFSIVKSTVEQIIIENRTTTIHAENLNCNKFSIQNGSNKARLKGGSIETLNIIGSYRNLYIKGTVITNVEIRNFGFLSECVWDAVTINKTLSINQSQLKNAEIRNCDFSRFKLIINNVKLFDTLFDAINWPSNSFITDSITELRKKKKRISRKERIANVRKEHIRVQHIYRHLKHRAEQANDRINYQRFKAFELDRYMRTISLWNRYEWANKINLVFGRYTNYFGLWWVQPILIYLGLSYLIFVITAGMKFPFLLSYSSGNINADFATFLNPTHDITKIGVFNTSNWLVILGDYIGRILQGLLAYQTIKGFRKSFF